VRTLLTAANGGGGDGDEEMEEADAALVRFKTKVGPTALSDTATPRPCVDHSPGGVDTQRERGACEQLGEPGWWRRRSRKWPGALSGAPSPRASSVTYRAAGPAGVWPHILLLQLGAVLFWSAERGDYSFGNVGRRGALVRGLVARVPAAQGGGHPQDGAVRAASRSQVRAHTHTAV
jgi:hypothetical protein